MRALGAVVRLAAGLDARRRDAVAGRRAVASMSRLQAGRPLTAFEAPRVGPVRYASDRS